MIAIDPKLSGLQRTMASVCEEKLNTRASLTIKGRGLGQSIFSSLETKLYLIDIPLLTLHSLTAFSNCLYEACCCWFESFFDKNFLATVLHFVLVYISICIFHFFSPSFSSIPVHHVSNTPSQEEEACGPHTGTEDLHHRATGGR